MLRFCILALLISACAAGQYPRKPADRFMSVDAQGVLRWQDDGSEVALFGVNYYPPCSIDYANLKVLGVDHKETIDRDLLHFERLGLDALRLHVFDREISDEKGNLLDNDHVDLLDYLIAQAKKRGIYTVLTPIAWWHAPGETRGFANLYDKAQMHTNPDAVAAQRNYLQQFVSHTNRYTGLAYGEDPAVPCFEIINEPIPAPGTTDDVIVGYIDALYDSMRSTGTQKPIFYNGWGGRHAAVARAKVEGCTFGWYPSGLVWGGVLTRNFLPMVNDYPDMRDELLQNKAKIVYEFDAADIPGGYIYPAMARSFRSGGAQIATQFQYDPLPLADTNVTWQTHFLNLVYAPSKTVSFVIAAEAFRRLPRLRRYGPYPDSCRFGDFRVSYEEQLSELATDEVFMYSNDTQTRPPAPRKLKRIVGCGSSPVVQYEGTGAYFLDRVSEGVWRLEVYPDCVWVADPFGATTLSREVSRVYWRERALEVSLPDLGPRFAVQSLQNAGGQAAAEEGVITVRPGAYVLQRPSAAVPLTRIDPSFYAPPQRDLSPAVWHTPAKALLEGKPLAIAATVACDPEPERVVLQVRSPEGGVAPGIRMNARGPYRFEATIPGELAKRGTLMYCVAVTCGGKELTLPDAAQGPATERFVTRDPVTILRFAEGETLPPVSFGGAPGKEAKAQVADDSVLRLTATGFGPPPSAAGIRFPLQASGEALRGMNTLVVRARSLEPETSHLEVGLIAAESNTSAYGADIPLSPAFQDFRIPLAKLKPLWQTRSGQCDPTSLRDIQLTFGSWLFPHAADRPHGLEVERVWLEYEPEAWRVPVQGADDPLVIFAPTEPLRGILSDLPYRQCIGPGSQPDTTAWHMEVEGFGPPPSCIGVRTDISELVAARQPTTGEYDTLRVRARATEPATTAIEIVLSEKDGAPWGFTPELTTEWTDIVVPLRNLRYFAHWSAPENRGGEGDHCHPENLAAVHITFGAWLYPGAYDQRHSFEIESILLEKGVGVLSE